MNGLYNLIFGVYPVAGPLLHELGTNYEAVPRFRDCFINKDGTEIIIYTRTGGNNRGEYIEGIQMLRGLPGYKYDKDLMLDDTYATFHYEVPERLQATCRTIAEKGHGVDIEERWKVLFEQMSKKEN